MELSEKTLATLRFVGLLNLMPAIWLLVVSFSHILVIGLILVNDTELERWRTAFIDSALAEAFADIPTATSNSGGSLTYGELTYPSIRAILSALEPLRRDEGGTDKATGLFVDLGSGFGRVLMGAACMAVPPFAFLRGVEIDSALHIAAQGALLRLSTSASPLNWILGDDVMTDQANDAAAEGKGKASAGPAAAEAGAAPPSTPVPRSARAAERITLHCADGTKEPGLWLDADVLYVCCTCFEEPLRRALGALVDRGLRRGALVVTVSRRLPSARLALVRTLPAECTWGHAEVFIERCT